jgi:hypothetical protein
MTQETISTVPAGVLTDEDAVEYAARLIERRRVMTRKLESIAKIVDVDYAVDDEGLLLRHDMDPSGLPLFSDRFRDYAQYLDNGMDPYLCFYLMNIEMKMVQVRGTVPDFWFDTEGPIDLLPQSRDILTRHRTLLGMFTQTKTPLAEPYHGIRYGDILAQPAKGATWSQVENMFACSIVVEALAELNDRRIALADDHRRVIVHKVRGLQSQLWERQIVSLGSTVLTAIPELRNSWDRIELFRLECDLIAKSHPTQ